MPMALLWSSSRLSIVDLPLYGKLLATKVDLALAGTRPRPMGDLTAKGLLRWEFFTFLATIVD